MAGRGAGAGSDGVAPGTPGTHAGQPEIFGLVTLDASGNVQGAVRLGAIPQGVALRSGDVRVPLPGAVGTSARGHAGRAVSVGVRPEHVVLAQGGEPGSFSGRVEVREPLGNEVLLHWSTPLGTLVARIPGQEAPQEGETHRLALAAERLHLFDRETERGLGAPAPVTAAST